MSTRLSPPARVVRSSCGHPRIVILLCLVLEVMAAAYVARHFAITSDTLELISPDLAWRRDKATFDAAFPQLDDLVVVVIDGATPELAESAAAALAARLSAQPALFPSVRLPDDGPFFRQNGLLYLAPAQVGTAMAQLIAAQPFLGTMTADPSLRGVMTSLSAALLGVKQGQATLDALAGPIHALADALEALDQGKPAFFSWQTLIAGKPATTRETRRIILLQVAVNHGALMPGAAATDTIREAARRLRLDPEDGVRVRLTGQVVLSDEELSSITENAAPMAAITGVAMLLILWLAGRSFRIVAAIAVTTAIGLTLSVALGLLLVGRLNLISIAFIPVFVGLGIDFAIQFSVRFRAEHLAHEALKDACLAAGMAVGGSLALAAASLAVGFFAFIPTAYVGASELGLIAGFGILIAFLLSITLLPALLTILRPATRKSFIDLPAPPRVGRDKLVLASGAAAAVVALALLPFLRFDFNPLHMRNPKSESVSTLVDLSTDSDRTPNTLDVLAPDLRRADELAGRLSKLPEVARTVTLSSFVPSEQTSKLAQIADAGALLDLTLDPIDVKPPPTDAETAQALAETARALFAAAASSNSQARGDAVRLAAALERLARPDASDLRARASSALIEPLKITLSELRQALQAKRVGIDTLPQDIKRDYLAPDGRARVQIFPSGDANDNRTLRRFSSAVRTLAPHATGAPVTIQEAARTIVDAFLEAGILAFLTVTVLLGLALRSVRYVAVTLVPILLGVLMTLASCVVMNEALNFTNIIALPLLIGIGVAFNIYFVIAWRAGTRNLLGSTLSRAVTFSALTTVAAFGSLALSSHPGTASMGRLLIVSVAWTLVVTLVFQPALLARATAMVPPPAHPPCDSARR